MIKAVSLIMNVAFALVVLGCEGGVALKTVGSANASKEATVKYRAGAKIVVEQKDGETAENYPVSLLDPAQVCADITFYNQDGEVVQGSRVCDGSAPLEFDPNLKAENIKAGISIGAIEGTLRSRPEDCASDGATDCVVVGPTYAAAITSGMAAKVLTGQSVAGILGSATPAPANCSIDGGTGCVAVTNFPAVDKASKLVAGNIKAGITIAGVSGGYPSVTYPLAVGDGYVDLDAATFNAKVKASANFGWFDRNGARFSAVGDTDITAANIKSGIDIFSTTGSFGANCTADGQTACLTTATYKSVDTSAIGIWDIRSGKAAGGVNGLLTFNKNLANLTTFNRTTGTAANASTTVADSYDTIDDYNNNGSMPTDVPSGFAAAANNWLRDSLSDTGLPSGTASNGICDGTEDCVYKDQMTGLYWAKDDNTTRTWEAAITYCEGLNYGTYTDWRLPVQKELAQVYINGLWSLKTLLGLSGGDHWSASSNSASTSQAWYMFVAGGYIAQNAKTIALGTLCVR